MKTREIQTQSRRRFLKNAASVSIPLLVPSFVITSCAMAQGRTMPSDRVRMGMIGTGRQCYLHNIPGFVRNKRCSVIALCDVDSWRLKESKKKVLELYEKNVSLTPVRPKSVETYVDYKELLARDDIDAIMISTPDHWHMEQTRDAFLAGKHVALEKPIVRTIADGREIVELAKNAKKTFRVDSEFRSGAAAHRAAELVRNGRLGKIHNVVVGVPGNMDQFCPPQEEMPVPKELDYQRWQGSAPKAVYTEKRVHPRKNFRGRPGWMSILSYDDGMVTNWGAHLMNGAMWALGLDRTFPVEIEGTGTYPEANSFWNVLTDFSIRYRFANDIEIVYRTEKPYFRIEGEHGWIEADFRTIKAEPASLLDEKIGDREIRFPLRSEKEDFIDSVLSGTEPLEPALVGHCVTSTCLLGHIAVRTGEKLRFDPEKEAFVGASGKAGHYLTNPILTPRD